MDPRTEQGSGLRFYSFGIVTEDKADDGDYIKVTPIEELPLVKGKLSEVKFDYDVKGTDHKGVSVSSNTKGVSYVVAKWAAMESGNRNTAPNVTEGETVLLLKYGTSDDVFWSDLFREPKLRRLENVIHSFSNLSDKGTGYDQETSYWFQVSTRDQVVQFHTSSNNKEPVSYDLVIDTSKGTFQIVDSNKNEIFLDSVNGDLKITAQNSIEMNAPMIRINGEQYVRTTSDEITNKAGSSATYSSDGSWDADAGGTINLHKTVIGDGDGIFSGISSDHHTHIYIPGDGSPAQSEEPT